MTFEIKDPSEDKPDEEKTIVETDKRFVVIRETNLKELKETLAAWEDRKRQAETIIPNLKAQIAEIEKLFPKK